MARRDETKRAFSFYKEGGKMYDKWAIDFQDRYPELCNEIEERGVSKVVKNMIRGGLSDDDIARYSNLPRNDISKIRRTLQ